MNQACTVCGFFLGGGLPDTLLSDARVCMCTNPAANRGQDKELDLGFLGVLEQVCLDQLRGGRTGAGQGPLGKLSVGTVTAEVNGSDLFNTPLEAKNIYQIMMTLVYDGHATVVNGLSENTSSRVDPYAAVTFKATGSAVDFDNSVTTTPCGTCPVCCGLRAPVIANVAPRSIL